jgi:hypothetical protein
MICAGRLAGAGYRADDDDEVIFKYYRVHTKILFYGTSKKVF